MSRRDAYVAIADPTRRQILSLLRRLRVLTAGEIAERFSHCSRPGISRHLRVLRDCGVIRVRRRGRAQLYTLNPMPLEKIRDGWLAEFGTMQRESLVALRRIVEKS